MSDLIRIEDIEEFRLVRRLPRTAISEEMLVGIRELNETTEIEPFLRSILPDPTKTAHGSTEIADILTPHITYGNRARHAAFVNKGKSTPKVTAKRVGHQLLELRQIKGLHLLVLLAVGDIQDDIKRDLVQIAADADADYMIVDPVDVARVFIAYQKICPRDGNPFVNGKCPNCGKSADEPVKVSMNVYEEPSYEVLSLSDVSTGVAKRYSADILTNRLYQKAAIKEVVKKATWELRHSDYYRSAITEAHFGQQEADCVFLFVYSDRLDKQHNNWICRAQWINPNLPEKSRPSAWRGQERLDDIVIDWNENHESRRSRFEHGTKRDWIQKVEAVLPAFNDLVKSAAEAFTEHRAGKVSDDDFERMLAAWEAEALSLSRLAGNGPLPPVECDEADSAFQQLAVTAHNIFVPFATWARVKRDWRYKHWHLQTYLDDYQGVLGRFQHEWEKVR